MSFFGSLLGGLTSLIPGVGSFLGPVVGGLMGGLGGSGTSGGSTMDPAITKNLKNLYGTADTSSTTGLDYAKTGMGTIDKAMPGIDQGISDIGTGQADLGTAGSFFKTILNGSREDTQKLLGPEVSTVLSQYDNAAKTASELGPRGGGRTGVMAEAETGKAGAYGKLLGSALPGAATGLSQIGSAEGQLGSEKGQLATAKGQLGVAQGQIGTDLVGKGISALGPGQAGQTAADKLRAEQMSGLGSGLGSIFMNLLKGLGGKSKSSGGSGNGDFGGETAGG